MVRLVSPRDCAAAKMVPCTTMPQDKMNGNNAAVFDEAVRKDLIAVSFPVPGTWPHSKYLKVQLWLFLFAVVCDSHNVPAAVANAAAALRHARIINVIRSGLTVAKSRLSTVEGAVPASE